MSIHFEEVMKSPLSILSCAFLIEKHLLHSYSNPLKATSDLLILVWNNDRRAFYFFFNSLWLESKIKKKRTYWWSRSDKQPSCTFPKATLYIVTSNKCTTTTTTTKTKWALLTSTSQQPNWELFIQTKTIKLLDLFFFFDIKRNNQVVCFYWALDKIYFQNSK